MAPKRRTLPLLLVLLLSAFALLVYPHLNTTSIPVPTRRNPDSAVAVQLFHKPSNFTFIIKVLAYNRLDSLSRCLRSLAAADYLSDTVHLHIYIDHFPLEDKSSSTVDHDLDNSNRILNFVDGFKWAFGDKLVHYRTRNAGLQAQWLEAWWPSSVDEFAFVVEDNLEVSPVFYKFVRAVIWIYYYDASNFSPSIYGVTLQRARFVPGKHGNKIQLDSGTRVFLYQLVGTWGQILFPRPWKEFRKWYDDHKAKAIKPLIEGMVTTGWYKRLGEKIWTPWFVKFIHSHGYFNIYTNFLHERALSVSHRDAGVNYAKSAGPDSELLDNKSLDFNSLDLQPTSKLKWYDFCFQEVIPGRIVKNSHNLESVLTSIQKSQTIILISLFHVPESITKNLLCHFQKLSTKNYILSGPRSDFLIDLARRGHPVIDVDEFLINAGARNLIKSPDSGIELVKDILVKTYVMKKCIELKYNILVGSGNMIFEGDNMLLGPADDLSFDLNYGKNLGFLFLRYSPSAHKHLGDILIQEARAVVSSSRNEIHSLEVVVEGLKRKGVRINRVEDGRFSVNIIAGSVNESSIDVRNKVLYWPNDSSSELVRRKLTEAGMWNLNSDDSCSAVLCHQS